MDKQPEPPKDETAVDVVAPPPAEQTGETPAEVAPETKPSEDQKPVEAKASKPKTQSNGVTGVVIATVVVVIILSALAILAYANSSS